ncbi:MAG: phospholipase A [Opitutaceae bacterium]|jgi:outer membrane phospholipase A
MNVVPRLLFSLVLALQLGSALRADSMLVLKNVSVGFESEIGVSWVVTNAGKDVLKTEAPSEIAARLHSGTLVSTNLVLRASGAPLSVEIPAGGYSRIEYTAKLPPGVLGPVVLEAPATGAPPVMFSVQAQDQAVLASQCAHSEDAEKAGKTQHETALRRSTRLLPGISAYEPVYFGVGMRGGTNAKFQISLKYNPFDLQPFYLGYTQTSFWDLNGTSKPFRDTSYRPSCFLQDVRLLVSPGGTFLLGGQAGFEHESNGKAGLDSRSINIGFIRPRLEWRFDEDMKIVLSPKLYGYIEKSENPDIDDYRGHADLYLGFLYRDWKLSATLRKGMKGGYGSVQADAVFPLRSTDSFLARIGAHGMNGAVFIQYFNGWGESILDYNRKLPCQFRAGLMLVP